MRTVVRTTALLEDAKEEVEDIITEIKQVSKDLAETSNSFDYEQLHNRARHKNSKETDRQDK